jgi:hypothetical protein
MTILCLVRNMRDREYIDQFLNDIKQDEELLLGGNMCSTIEFHTSSNRYIFIELNEKSKGMRVDQVIIEARLIPDERQFNTIIRPYLGASYVPDEFQIQVYG